MDESLQLYLLLYLRVCQGELSRHIHQVTLFWVTLHPHVPIILHFRWMRPVLVALGLQAYDINQQITLQLTWVISQDTIYYCCDISCAQLSWNQTHIQQPGMFHAAVWGTKAIYQQQDVNWLSIYKRVCVCVIVKKRETQGTWLISRKWSINESIWLPGNRQQAERKTSSFNKTLISRCFCLRVDVSSPSNDFSHCHPAHTLHLAILHFAKPCNYSQLCQLITLCANITSNPRNYSNHVLNKTWNSRR